MTFVWVVLFVLVGASLAALPLALGAVALRPSQLTVRVAACYLLAFAAAILFMVTANAMAA